MRQAVNYAIDRAALARLGNPFFPLPADPTDHYLPPGIPGHVNGHIYPLVPDLTKARRLAKGHAGATAVLYTCDRPACTEQAQIIKNDLAAIGVRVVVKAFPVAILFARVATPGEPFDISYDGWAADYPDPQGVLDPLLENSSILPPLDDPSYRAKLRAAARLSGPERYLGYARLDRDLARNAAPLAVYDNPSSHELLLRPDGLPDLRVLRHRPRRAVHQTRRPLSVSDEARPQPQSRTPLAHENPAAAARRLLTRNARRP